MRNVLLIILLFCGLGTKAQFDLQLLDPNLNWILNTDKIQKKQLEFENYSKSKVELNTMVWKFLPNGRLDYDYQSSEDVNACAGVDFLDMDVEECRWAYNPSTLIMTLQIKGGYASIDDFVFKRDYLVGMLDSETAYGYTLTLVKEHYYNDLRKARK